METCVLLAGVTPVKTIRMGVGGYKKDQLNTGPKISDDDNSFSSSTPRNGSFYSQSKEHSSPARGGRLAAAASASSMQPQPPPSSSSSSSSRRSSNFSSSKYRSQFAVRNLMVSPVRSLHKTHKDLPLCS